jgi:hypothetical protein
VDTAGKEQFKQCFYAKELDYRDHSAWYYVNQDTTEWQSMAEQSKDTTPFIDLSRLPTANLDQVRVAIVRGPNC